MDECMFGDDNCDMNAVCTNVPGSFECKCIDGYAGDGTSCNGKIYTSSFVSKWVFCLHPYVD